MNKILLCLIPKVTTANMIMNYRPIKLCYTTYKLINKIIVNKLKLLLNTNIGPSQAIFLFNRRASGESIIVQEFFTYFKKIKGMQGNMIPKIDLGKAFNKIEWSFIRETIFLF